jgi:hypothetical protein
MSAGVFRCVPRLEIPSIWPEALAVLTPAFNMPGLAERYLPDDILSRLTDARWQLWVFEVDDKVTTACITTVDVYPRMKAVRICAIAGTGFQLWEEWLRDIAEWAQEIGCRKLIGDGRMGWKRIVPMEFLGASYSAEVSDLVRELKVANG